MANFTPKKEASKAKGSLPTENSEYQDPPTMYLQEHHLKALGFKEMPKVGSKIKISGLAHVGSTNESSDHSEKGKGPRRSMTLHMHKMEVGRDEHDHEESQKAGMKGEIDKALKKGAGSESEDDGEQ
jgi:hypothetical protein